MIDFLEEDVFPLSDGPVKLGISYRTLDDLIRRGRKGSGGQRVKLEFCKMESGRGTSIEAYRRFLMRLNDMEVVDGRV